MKRRGSGASDRGRGTPARSERRRGEGADWQDTWPPVGVRQGEPEPSAGVDALRAEGFRAMFDVEPQPGDEDRYQDHLNNNAPVRMFNELRVAYVAAHLTPDWPRHIRRSNSTVVVRELHVQYETEGWMHERFVGAIAWRARRGKSGLVEQRLVEADDRTPARPRVGGPAVRDARRRGGVPRLLLGRGRAGRGWPGPGVARRPHPVGPAPVAPQAPSCTSRSPRARTARVHAASYPSSSIRGPISSRSKQPS